MPQPRIGFIGIGNMGWPMAGHIQTAGYSLTVFDTDQARVAKFINDHKCQSATTPAALGKQSDIVITMLPDGKVVRGVLFEDGLADALTTGSIIIDMSSSDPVGTQEIGKLLSARGIAMIDAPVSGGVPRAITGKLSIMIGHDDAAALARAMPLLKTMGERLFETGPLGSGHAMKALNNFCGAAGYAAAAEALIIGRRFGLDPHVVIDVINASTGRNFSSEMLFKDHVLGEQFGTGFSVGLLAKDVKTAADLAAHLGVNAPLGKTVASLWAEARDDLGPGADHTKAITSWDKK